MKDDAELVTFARDALGLPTTVALKASALGKRGSDRRYYRLNWQVTPGFPLSAILVEYNPERIENAYFADLAGLLGDIGVPAPKIIRHDPKGHLTLMEDLGNIDLWSLRSEPWEIRRSLYQKTLAVVNRLHSFPRGELGARDVRLMAPFDASLYRWERTYYLEHFVGGLCGINLQPEAAKELEEELSNLADRLLTTPSCLIHRDLQSQNVMIRSGNPVLIDFQGMRFGNAFYDLGSLLCDPYVEFTDDERHELLHYYYGLSEREFSWMPFREHFWEASAQRLMQALGAYGFLGCRKGLADYLQHVPAALRNLLVAAGHASSLYHLERLCHRCGATLARSAPPG
jgi:N-acetylmuramate 1-kinase